jgi:hypothetical protein
MVISLKHSLLIGAMITSATLSPALAASAVPDPISMHLSPAENLKSYALSACIGYGFPEAATVQAETGLASQAYIEAGRFGIEAYNEAAALARDFVAKNYLSEKGEKWTVIKCIDLFHSKELAKIVQKYDKARQGRGQK